MQLFKVLSKNSLVYVKYFAKIFIFYSGAQKMTPCAKKDPCEKMSLGKKPFHKSFIFLVDKLNMMNFNIFKILKLIFTCESCAISITK